MASTKSKEEREGKEIKKRKVILSQTTLNHQTHVIERANRCRDESNDAAKSQLQSPKPVAHAARRGRRG
jgi:hypothetical protein